jgi:hypothetical protein
MGILSLVFYLKTTDVYLSPYKNIPNILKLIKKNTKDDFGFAKIVLLSSRCTTGVLPFSNRFAQENLVENGIHLNFSWIPDQVRNDRLGYIVFPISKQLTAIIYSPHSSPQHIP